MNIFYACLDAGFFKYVPPTMQHLAIADMARKQDGSMAFAIAALGATGPTRIKGSEAVDVSYPGFFDTLDALRQT